jgi:hypothetical protein
MLSTSSMHHAGWVQSDFFSLESVGVGMGSSLHIKKMLDQEGGGKVIGSSVVGTPWATGLGGGVDTNVRSTQRKLCMMTL